jgi:hypothetical protein
VLGKDRSGHKSHSPSGSGSGPLIIIPREFPNPPAHHHPAKAKNQNGGLPAVEPYSPPAATESNPQRSTLADRLLAPNELDLSAENLAEGGALALILVALLYLPVTIFNKATEKNHATISAWMARPRAWVAFVTTRIPFSSHPLWTLIGGVLASTALFAFVEPHFPTEDGALEYLIGMMLGFTLVAVVFFSTWHLVIKRLEPNSTGHWRIYPPYIILAALLVVFARLAHFLPGVVLGTVAEYEPKEKLSTRTAGIRVATTYGALIVLGLAAWFAWIPVTEAAEKEGASTLTLILDSMLAITFVSALESVAFGLIPMKFLDGNDLYSWHKGLWAGMWGAALFWFALVILHPALSTYEELSSTRALFLVLLFSSLMIVALTTWGYFRVRDARLARAGEQPS